MIEPRDRLILAMDVNTIDRVSAFLDKLQGLVGVYKVGLELFTSLGAEAVRAVNGKGGKVFLDLKLHDIPKTVEKAAASVARLGAYMTTVHCLGGRDAVAAARQGLESAQLSTRSRPLLLAVTLLTSHKTEDLKAVFPGDWVLEDKVLELAAMAAEAGADGVVCSPREVRAVKKECPGLLAVTPGVRFAKVTDDDQARTATPAAAIADGADYLVVGRPICQAPDPAAAAGRILREIESAFDRR